MTAAQALQTETVRQLAAAVRDCPADTARRCALEDAAQEAGCSPLAARRLVRAVIREADATRRAAELERAATLLAERRHGRLRRVLRLRAGRHVSDAVPVVAVEGSARPRLTGSPGGYFTPGGRPVAHPNAYRRAWGKPIYRPSTERVTVGAGYVLRLARSLGIDADAARRPDGVRRAAPPHAPPAEGPLTNTTEEG